MASILVGTAAATSASGAMISAPTVGLFGAGGTFSGLATSVTLANTALIGGLGLGAVGMIGQANAAAAAAKGQAAVAKYNALVQKREADAIEQATVFRQRRQAEAAQRQQSSLEAALGASGAVPTAGTPLMIQSKQAAESELDNLMIGFDGQTAADRARSKGKWDSIQAGIFSRQAGNAMSAGYAGAGSSLLTGFGKLAMKDFS